MRAFRTQRAQCTANIIYKYQFIMRLKASAWPGGPSGPVVVVVSERQVNMNVYFCL